MSAVANRPALALAIQARVAVREAIDRDDMPTVRALRGVADDACGRLGDSDSAIYRAWALEGIQAMALSVGAS